MRADLRNETSILLGLALLAALGITMRQAPSRQWALTFIQYVRNPDRVGFLLYALTYVVGTILLYPGTLLNFGNGF